MPNWCSNRWDIYCEDAEVMKRVYDAITDAEGMFTFATLVPMPAVLEDTSSPIPTWGIAYINGEGLYEMMKQYTWFKPETPTEEGARKWLEDNRPNEIKDGRKALQAMNETGYASWYEWRSANWGCKWDANNYGTPIEFEDGDDNIHVEFDTPWGPPEAFLAKLRETFPEVSVTAFYDEPGMCMAGYL